MKTLIIFFLTFQSTLTFAQNKNGTYEFQLDKGLQLVEISASKGALFISENQKKNQAVVEVKKIKWDKDCEESVTYFGPTLNIKIKSSSLFSKSECRVDLKVLLPKSVDLEISHATMNTEIQNIVGDLTYKSASGNLKAVGEFKRVEVKVASSDLMLEGLTGEGNFIGASSEMKLIYKNCPEKPSKLSINRASGDVQVFIPKNCKLKTQNKTASGDSFNEFGDSKDYDLDVSSVSASGDLTIKKLK